MRLEHVGQQVEQVGIDLRRPRGLNDWKRAFELSRLASDGRCPASSPKNHFSASMMPPLRSAPPDSEAVIQRLTRATTPRTACSNRVSTGIARLPSGSEDRAKVRLDFLPGKGRLDDIDGLTEENRPLLSGSSYGSPCTWDRKSEVAVCHESSLPEKTECL